MESILQAIEKPTEEILAAVVNQFWETIPPAWNLIRAHLRATAAADFDITVEQFHILRHMRKGMVSASELATAQQISRPAISQALDALVDKGLVTRCENANDRRYIQLELTPAGTELLNAIFQKNRAWMTEKMNRLNAEEMDQLLRGLETINKVFIDTQR